MKMLTARSPLFRQGENIHEARFFEALAHR